MGPRRAPRGALRVGGLVSLGGLGDGGSAPAAAAPGRQALNPSVTRRLPTALALAAAAMAAPVALAALLGGRAAPLARSMPTLVAVASTATAGATLICMQVRGTAWLPRRLATALAGTSLAIGLASVAYRLAASSLPTVGDHDLLFARPVGGLVVALYGAAGIGLGRRRGATPTAVELVAVPLGFSVALLFVLAHLLDAPGVYLLFSQQLLLPVPSYCFLLNGGALWLARSGAPAIAALLTCGLGATVARRLLLFGMAAVVCIAALTLALFRHGQVGYAEATTLLVFSLSALFFAFARREAALFNALDAGRAELLAAMAERETQLTAAVADLKRVEAELHDAVRARDICASIASHELRSPLTALHLRTEVFARHCRRAGAQLSVEAAEHFVAQVTVAVRQLDRLVGDMLDVARTAAGTLQVDRDPVDVGQAMRESYDRLAPELAAAGMAVACHTEQGTVCTGDAQRLEQVFTNLLTNALRYAPRANLELRVRRRGAWVVALVCDDGPGIEPAKQSEVFGRFARANGDRAPGGLGLGLFIGRQIVQAHGGTLTLRSRPGAGATFEVALPAR